MIKKVLHNICRCKILSLSQAQSMCKKLTNRVAFEMMRTAKVMVHK